MPRLTGPLAPEYWQTLSLAREAWNSHHEIGLAVTGRRALTLPDGRELKLNHDEIDALVLRHSLEHTPAMRSGRPEYAAYCTGCPHEGDYRQCQYAGWLRCWRLWDAHAREHKDLRDSGLSDTSKPDDDRLHVTIGLAAPIGPVAITIDRDGFAYGPGAVYFRRADLLRAEIRRVHTLHTPIGPALGPPPAIGPQRLCRECIREWKPVAYYDQCVWRRFAHAWAGAPQWLWTCIGKPYTSWPACAKNRYLQGITTTIAARGQRRPTKPHPTDEPAVPLLVPAATGR